MNSKENKFLNLIVKVLTKKASPQEKQALEDWAKEDSKNQAFVEDTRNSWQLFGNYAEEIPVDTNLAWAKFETKLAATASSSNRVKKLWRNWQAVAAVLAFVSLTLWWGFSNNNSSPIMTEVETGEGEQKELSLPDGSTVMLNENSSLVYNQDFENRKVTLRGEAFFEVQKQENKKFEIRTKSTKTTVLGTSFNVRAYQQDNTVEVIVLNGKVAFEELAEKANKVLLSANESAVFDKKSKGLKKATDSNVNSIAWKTQQLLFDNIELSKVIVILERFFDVEIEIQNAETLKCRFTGDYTEPSLQDIFKAISFSMSIEIKKVEQKPLLNKSKYILIGQGCDNIEN